MRYATAKNCVISISNYNYLKYNKEWIKGKFNKMKLFQVGAW